MITVGPMALNQPQAPDAMEPFFLGTMSGGGYHTDMSRLSAHDHSGGLMGAAVAVSIPDGSITAADLDPSVLAPYALVDGSKPFTGQVTLQADAVVRDALLFGQQGTALAPDAALTRTAAGVLGLTGALSSATGTAARLAIGATGSVSLSPDAGGNAVLWSAGSGQGALGVGQGAGLTSSARLYASQYLSLDAGLNYVMPERTGAINFGSPSLLWLTLYAQTGAINTSSAAVKEGITPLDPAACYQAAKDVRWYEYAYRPPAYQAPAPLAGEDADTLEQRVDESKAAHARMLVETAPARHQRGFVFPAGAASKDEAGGTLPPVPDLFGLADRESTTPQADLATLGCALQEVIRRLEQLEAPAA